MLALPIARTTVSRNASLMTLGVLIVLYVWAGFFHRSLGNLFYVPLCIAPLIGLMKRRRWAVVVIWVLAYQNFAHLAANLVSVSWGLVGEQQALSIIRNVGAEVRYALLWCLLAATSAMAVKIPTKGDIEEIFA